MKDSPIWIINNHDDLVFAMKKLLFNYFLNDCGIEFIFDDYNKVLNKIDQDCLVKNFIQRNSYNFNEEILYLKKNFTFDSFIKSFDENPAFFIKVSLSYPIIISLEVNNMDFYIVSEKDAQKAGDGFLGIEELGYYDDYYSIEEFKEKLNDIVKVYLDQNNDYFILKSKEEVLNLIKKRKLNICKMKNIKGYYLLESFVKSFPYVAVK